MQQRPIRIPMPSSTIKALMFANIGVFVVTLLLTTDAASPLTRYLGVSPNNVFEWFGLGVVRLVTASFTHDIFSPWHILLNMLFLWMFGRIVESEVSQRGLLHLYLVGGVAGALGHIGLMVVLGGDNLDVRMIGASASVAAIMVYAACMLPNLPTMLLGIPLWVMVAVVVGLDAFSAIQEIKYGLATGVANGGHLGGALAGYIAFKRYRNYYVRLGYGSKDMFPALSRWKEGRKRQSAADEQKTLDSLLEKVGREGMGALTGAERRFLEKASKRRRGS